MRGLENPMTGDYTKGISRDSDYFSKLARRFAKEKEIVRPLFLDLQNPLLKMLNAPETVADMTNFKASTRPQKVAKKVTNQVRGWVWRVEKVAQKLGN